MYINYTPDNQKDQKNKYQDETAYLLRHPTNTQHLMTSIAQLQVRMYQPQGALTFYDIPSPSFAHLQHLTLGQARGAHFPKLLTSINLTNFLTITAVKICWEVSTFIIMIYLPNNQTSVDD